MVKEVTADGRTESLGTTGDVITTTSGTDSTGNNFEKNKTYAISRWLYISVMVLGSNSNLTGDTAGTPGTSFVINLYDWHDANSNAVIDGGELSLVTSRSEERRVGK